MLLFNQKIAHYHHSCRDFNTSNVTIQQFDGFRININDLDFNTSNVTIQLANIFSALHALFDIEWAYGLRPTIKDGKVYFKFEERLPSAGSRPQEDLDNFQKMVEYWACLRDKLEDGKITETDYYLKEIKFPMNPIVPDKEYTVSLNLDDDDQLLVQNMNEDEKAGETAELLKDLFPDFSYVKRKRKPKKE